jgi:hypothetical protein
MRYELLKREFQRDAMAFARTYSGEDLRLQAIATLARAKNDNGWPLGILEVLLPELAGALADWTAGGYESIRRAQEAGRVATGSAADLLQKNFAALPRWRGTAVHLSKSLDFFDQLRNERELTLRSFMCCSAPPYKTVIDGPDVVTLRFTKLLTARLVGALSTENLEREVLLPTGARFAVVGADIGRVLILHEVHTQVAATTSEQSHRSRQQIAARLR